MTIDFRSARLVAISFVSLFLELALIRCVNSTVQIIAYFNNFLILSAFLGLGFGSLLYRRRIDLFRHFPLILCVVIALMCVLEPDRGIRPGARALLFAGEPLQFPGLRIGTGSVR